MGEGSTQGRTGDEGDTEDTEKVGGGRPASRKAREGKAGEEGAGKGNNNGETAPAVERRTSGLFGKIHFSQAKIGNTTYFMHVCKETKCCMGADMSIGKQ